ncbi:putative reverse transcriptase domain-containing protein [Tanacetum coccineum]
MRTRQTEIAVTHTEVDRRPMDAFNVDLGFIKCDVTRVSDDVLALQEDRARDREENMRLKRRMDELKVSNTLAAMDRDKIKKEFFSMRVWVSGFMYEVMGRGIVEARPSKSIDVLAVYGDVKHSESQGPPYGPRFVIMERGFLSSSSMNKKDNREDKTKKGSVFSDLASKITNIDGKMIGKDGKPLLVVRRVVFHKHISVAEDVSTDADVSDAMRYDCNNDGSSGEAANVDKNAASGNVNGISSFASLVRPNSVNSKVNSVNGISQWKEGSFASLLRPKEVTNKLRFRTLGNKEKFECSDCVLPKAAANLVKSRYENSIVGFFVGKDPSFPVVQNYVSNTRSKFGFEKITRNDNGVYLFKFASKAGLEQVLERGPWMIRKSPIILNKWSSSVSLKKGEVTKVLVWVKLYNVPVLTYSEDGLSLIAAQIGKPVMLDAFTSSMCVESWGKISFARARIEISSASTLKKEVIMAIPEEEGDGHIKEVIRVKYERKPPHCVECKSFGHSHDLCPKRVRDEVPKAPSMAVKPSTMHHVLLMVLGCRNQIQSGTTKESDKGVKVSSPSRANQNMTTPLSNSFDVLNTVKKEDVQNPKVSDHAGTSSLNLHVNKDQEKSLWLRFNKGKENAKSKSSELEDESDDDEVYMPHGGGFTDGMEDDLECYDGYGTHVYDLTPQEQAFCDQYDIRLNSHGRK